VDFRLSLAIKLMIRRKGNFIAAVSALVIGIMVILFNSLIFNGVAQGILRDLADYRFGHIVVSKNEGNFEKETVQVMNYIQRYPYVQSTAPRLSSIAWFNSTDGFTKNEVDKIQVIGVDPNRDPSSSKLFETVQHGSFLKSDGEIVLGSHVARDLKAGVGSRIDAKMIDSEGDEVIKSFVVVGISQSPGGLAFDDSAIMTIDAIRDMTKRPEETGQIIVRLSDPAYQEDLKSRLLGAYEESNLNVETLEEAGEQTLAGIRSGIAFINLVGLFGMLSASFAIVTIMMLMVSSKTRDIGIMKAIGANSMDILLVFVFQGLIIGCLAAAAGFAVGTALALYLQSIEFSFGPGLILEVTYDPLFTLTSSLFAIALGTAAAVYPAFRASRLEPVDAMQHS
jgi:lipoprotein-releasing system permease protein